MVSNNWGGEGTVPPDTVMSLWERAPLALCPGIPNGYHGTTSSPACSGELAVHIDHGLVGVPGGYEGLVFLLFPGCLHPRAERKLLASYIDETSQSRVLVVTLPVANDGTSRVSAVGIVLLG